MTLVFLIEPLIGVGPVRIGMTREESRHAMSSPPTVMGKQGTGNTPADGYLRNGFQVHFDSDDRVGFIELCRDPSFSCVLYDVPVLRTPAAEVIANLSRKYAYDPNDRELGYTFIFPDIELGFWRPIIPKSARAREGRYFDTVGIGIHGYYSSDRPK